MDAFTQFDGNLLIGIQHALNADWLTPVMIVLTSLGNAGMIWICMCVVLVMFRKTRRLGIICTCALIFTFICCNLILKPLIDRPRPWETFQAVHAFLPPPGDASFPSGHSANSMGPAWAMYIATAPVRKGVRRVYDGTPCLGWKGDGLDPRIAHRISIAAVILALLIGLSRLYLGMHYPSDVVCGLLLGMICASIVHFAIKKTEAKSGIIGR